jgi:O-antigen ligase
VTWCAVALAFVVLTSAATHSASDPYAPLYVSRWLPFLILVIALVDTVAQELRPWHALWAILLGTAWAATGALYSMLIGGHLRATGPLSDPNDLAYVLTAAVPIALVAARYAPARRTRLLAVVILGLCLLGAAATLSRGGGFALAAVVVWALMHGLLKVRHLIAGAVAAALAGLVVLSTDSTLVAEALGQKGYIASTNVETRTLRWLAALRMLGAHPVLGVGPGGFRSSYAAYGHLSELGELTPVTHNMYLEVGAELGLLGLVVFLAILLAAFAATREGRRGERLPTDGRSTAVAHAALAVQGGLLAVVVTSFFLSEEYYLTLWGLVSLAAALDVRARRVVR